MGGAPLRGGLRERKPLPLAHPHPPVSGAADRPDTQGMGPGGRCPGREEQGIQTAEITRECAGGSAGRARGRGQRAPGTHCASQAARDLDSEASEAGRSGPQRPGAGAAAGSADSSAASRARGAARARPPLCREVRARAAAPSLRNFPVPPPPRLRPRLCRAAGHGNPRPHAEGPARSHGITRPARLPGGGARGTQPNSWARAGGALVRLSVRELRVRPAGGSAAASRQPRPRLARRSAAEDGPAQLTPPSSWSWEPRGNAGLQGTANQ